MWGHQEWVIGGFLKYDTKYDIPIGDYDEVFSDDDGYPD